MSKLSFSLRYTACVVWIIGGLIAGGSFGYMSAFSSFLFLIAMRLDSIGYED